MGNRSYPVSERELKRAGKRAEEKTKCTDDVRSFRVIHVFELGAQSIGALEYEVSGRGWSFTP